MDQGLEYQQAPIQIRLTVPPEDSGSGNSRNPRGGGQVLLSAEKRRAVSASTGCREMFGSSPLERTTNRGKRRDAIGGITLYGREGSVFRVADSHYLVYLNNRAAGKGSV